MKENLATSNYMQLLVTFYDILKKNFDKETLTKIKKDFAFLE